MLKSEPNAKCCLWKPFLSKITLRNESNFKVKYEAYPYKGSAIGKIDAAIGAGGLEGKAALDIIQAENIKPEVSIIAKNDSRYVTVSGSQKVAIRYMYLDLHDDYTEEVRNFGVLDLVKFVQPPQEDIDEILRTKREALEEAMRKAAEEKAKIEREQAEQEERIRKAEEEAKRKADEEKAKIEKEQADQKERARKAEEEAKRKAIEIENIKRKCSTKAIGTCSASDTPKRQCPHCHDWYCNYHYRVNNNAFGGGHVCKH
jgi:hypothetical protein